MMNAKEKAIKQIQKEVMSSQAMMKRFIEEIADEENLYCRAIDIAIKAVLEDIAKKPLYVIDKGKGKIKYMDVGDADWFKELKEKYLNTLSQ